MPSHGSCASCQRRYRSSKTRELCERRAAIVADLRDGVPAPHLAYTVSYSGDLPKQEKHRVDSAKFLAGQT